MWPLEAFYLYDDQHTVIRILTQRPRVGPFDSRYVQRMPSVVSRLSFL